MGKKIEKIGRLEWLLFERAEPALVLAVLAVAPSAYERFP